jgi:putative ABC transport system substrate-binding protein
VRRREFITVLGGAAATWPLAVRAQQPAMPVVAFFSSTTADGQASNVAAFRKGLGEAGYVEGQNVAVEYHWLDGHFERLPALLADAIRRRVAVIATPGSNPSTLAAKAATATIPIVFGVGQDPVAMGLVASLAHPGGNATGINYFSLEVNAKRLGLMHELLPKATRFGMLVNPGNATSAEAAAKALTQAAPALGLKILSFKARVPAELDAAFAALARERGDALFVANDGFFHNRRVQIATLAVRDRIATGVPNREMVEAGALMSYGTSIIDAFRQVGAYVSTILKGSKPADLPVLQASKFEFVINLQTARSIGLDIPPLLLARADEVIE